MIEDQVVEIEDQVAEIEPKVFLGRNRFLTLLGSTMFAFAYRMVVAGPAWATHLAPKYPCHGYNACDVCQGSTCKGTYCRPPTYITCKTKLQCWTKCDGGYLYSCCDWETGDGTPCICRGKEKQSCCGNLMLDTLPLPIPDDDDLLPEIDLLC